MNEQQDIALQQAIEWINNNYQPTAIIVSGSIIRGNGNANSDLDIFVVHNEAYRQRVQRFFHGVPCEIFINNKEHILAYFEQELKNNRPVTANMLATGKVIVGNDIVDDIIEQAKLYSQRSLKLSDTQLNARNYLLVTLLEDAHDLLTGDPNTAQLVLNKVIEQSIELILSINQQPMPRIKERLKALHVIDAEKASNIYALLQNKDVQEKYVIARDLVLKLTGHTSFYEWESDKD